MQNIPSHSYRRNAQNSADYEKSDSYRFADYKEKVIDLIMRVTTVSVETVKIVEDMKIS